MTQNASTPPTWLLDALALAAGLEPGSVSVLQIAHDDECPHLTGGRCSCEPDFRLVTVDPTEERR